MAITINTPASSSGESDTFTFPYTHSGDNGLLMVNIKLIPNAEQKVLSITYNGIALMNLLATQCENKAYSDLWYLINPPVGTFDIVVTLVGYAKTICVAVSMNGVNQETPFYFKTNIAGDMVTEIPFTIQEETGNLILGMGFTNSLSFSYLLPGQTELWNITYNSEMRTQAVYAYSTNTGELEIPNYLNQPSTWVMEIFNIKAAV